MICVWNNEKRRDMNHTLTFMYKGDFKGNERIKIKSSGVYRMFINGSLSDYGLRICKA